MGIGHVAINDKQDSERLRGRLLRPYHHGLLRSFVQVALAGVNDLVNLAGPGSGFTIVGAGETAMDACTWLLEQGVDPGAIRWIRPRDAWLLDRRFQQPSSCCLR